MPVHLNIFERLGLLRLNLGPGPMADLLGLLACKAALAGLRLGVFESLSGRSEGTDELSARIGADGTGISLLLNALESLGYVKNRRGKWLVTPMTKKWMLAGSPYDISGLFHQFSDMSLRWDYLHESIKEGRPPLLGYEWLDRHPDKWDHYQAGLKSAAVLVSRELFKKIKIPNSARRLIDLGGGHGQYCIEFCKKYPGLSGTVYDWPQAEKTALGNINGSGLSGRVTFRPGDFVKDDIGSSHDIILMFNVIRIFKADELRSLLCKAHASLANGGMIIIMDHLGHYSRSPFMKANAFLVLLELYNSTKGRTHKAADVISLLHEAGFSKTSEYALKRSPGLGVLTAFKS
jgi:hypothetical protein